MKKYIINIKNVCFLVCLIISMSINSQTIRTVGTAGNYASLTTAFTDINNGVITGNIELQIISSYTVTSLATLNASGSGSASYTSISIYPTGVGGYSIQHNIAGNGIVLSGADNVTFDGRVNRTGSTRSLTIANTNTGTSACVIRFLNSAENNIIRWCNIRGAGPNSSAGMITFGGVTAGNGNNDGNTIDNCDITTSASTLPTRPRSAIYSLGSSGFSNDNITVSNNNIYNFYCNLASASVSTGIYLVSFSSTWTISGNSFYETAGWSGTPFSNVVCIQIGTSTTGVGSGYTITNNSMGGSSANATGTWTISATSGTAGPNPHFTGIYIRTEASGVTNSIQGNTIKNISINTLQSNPFTGIYVYSGNDFNIGNTTGNTIQTISAQSSSTAIGKTCGIDFGTTSSAFGNLRIENNTIADINVNNSSNRTNSVYGISFLGTSNTFLDLNINNNSIGGTGGIRSQSAGASTTGQVVAGIYLGSGNNGNYNTTISGNTIWNLQNTATDFSSSQTHMICGIFSDCRLTTGTNLITRNFIHSLKPQTTTRVDTRGITTANINSGNSTYSNNIISIGTGITVDSPMSGLWVSPGTASQPNKVYHNTVYIGGGSTSITTNPTYAIYSYNINTATGNDVRNNIAFNARSGQASSASKHYAIRFASGSFSTTYTANYNDYFVSGTNGVFGQWGFLDVTSLASWKTSTGQEANTINTNPTFASAGGTLPANYLPSATVNGLSGISGAPTIDHFQNTRPSTPKMGALESSCIPPNGTVAFGAFTSVGSSSITVNTTFTNGTNLANGYVLLRNTTNTAPTAPTSGTAVPSAGSTSFVSGYTVVGSSTTLGSSVAFVSSGLASGTTYYYWVIPYQNTGGPCWLTTSTQSSNSQATSVATCRPPNGTVAFGSFISVTSTTTTTNVTYTDGVDVATGYILLRSTSASLPTAPASGTSLPTAGNTTFVSGYTVVDVSTTIGSGVSFVSSGLSPSTTYNYFVMAYQNSNGPCYFTPGTQANNSQETPCSAPSAPTGSSPQSFCSSANPTIASLSATGTAIQWYDASSGGNLLNSSTSLVSGNTYYATQTVSSCESTSRLSVLVTITNNPVSVSTTSSDVDNTICSGTSVTFTATPTNGGGSPSYQWKLNGSNVGSNSSTYATTSLANGDAVSVVLTSNITCPTGSPATSNTINTTVNNNPTANVSPATPSTCEGVNLSLNGNPSGGSGTWSTHTWTGAGSSSLGSTTIENPTFNNATAGNYSLTYTVTDGNGCVGSDVESVTVNSCVCTIPDGTVSFGSFTSVTSTTTTTNVTYTNGSNSANGFIVLRNTSNTPPTAPSSGIAVPSIGSTTFVSGYVVSDVSTTIGSSIAVSNTSLTPSTTYYYWVMSYQNTYGPCWYTPTTQNSNSQATSASGLPIELVSFTVKCVGNNDRLFEWKTASEYNNSYFTIESSKDFVNWNTIHVQSGAGNSTQLINYTLIKKSPYSSGVEYWRLRQTDFDGTSKITGSISIECRSDEYLVYFVNPIEDETIKGTIQSLVDSDATIEIFTEIGQLVSKKELNIKAGANFVSIDDLDLSSAMYFVILTIGDSVFIHKVIVIN